MKPSVTTLAVICAALVLLCTQTALSHPGDKQLFSNPFNRLCSSFAEATLSVDSPGDPLSLQPGDGAAPIMGDLYYLDDQCGVSGGTLLIPAKDECFSVFAWGTPEESAQSYRSDATGAELYGDGGQYSSTYFFIGVTRNNRLFSSPDETSRANLGWRYSLSAGMAGSMPLFSFGDTQHNSLHSESTAPLWSSVVLTARLTYDF
jgi:hypothetical protein